MRDYQINQNFQEALSTKRTLFGATSTNFFVYYAPIDDLGNTTPIVGGMNEAIETVGTAHTATTTTATPYGSKVLHIDGDNSDLVAGEVIEYSTGKFAYVRKIINNKVYLKTPTRISVASGATLTQVGNTGEYKSGDIAIPTAGEYAITIESPEYGIVVTDRVRVVAEETTAVDTDAPDDTVAVAY